MTCKDCVHNEVCCGTHTDDSPTCCDFKDKSRFIELPCAKGDTVYEVIASHHIREGKVFGFHFGEFTDLRGNKRKNYLIVKYYYDCLHHLPFERIGKNVFFNREEAEKTIQERKNVT